MCNSQALDANQMQASPRKVPMYFHLSFIKRSNESAMKTQTIKLVFCVFLE